MKHRKYIKKMRFHAGLTSLLTGAICLMALPLIGSVQRTLIKYYRIVADGRQYGYYTDAQKAADTLREARKKIAKEQGEIVYEDMDCGIICVQSDQEHTHSSGVDKKIYREFKKHRRTDLAQAYTIRVSDYTVTVASEPAVVSAMEAVKSSSDPSNSYQISLQEEEQEDIWLPAFTAREGVDTAGITQMGFEQEVEVGCAYVRDTEIVTPEAAAASLTKEWDTPAVYVVELGDCLSVIAEKNGMKTQDLVDLNQLSDADRITEGDELLITVPQPELSVWYKTQTIYEETYEPETEYQYNDSWYAGTEQVVQEGRQGRRQVLAEITYSQGKEVGRDILQETVLEEPQTRIVIQGTNTPPSYIKPLVGGSFSSPFGSRWGRMHKGVDWSCSIGTAVKASCAGRVVGAGWVNGYGKCVTISHSDGNQTRYAHLSEILVSVGDRVQQGDKIALSGNTGNSTGPHLHFEILVGGTQVNPLDYLQ